MILHNHKRAIIFFDINQDQELNEDGTLKPLPPHPSNMMPTDVTCFELDKNQFLDALYIGEIESFDYSGITPTTTMNYTIHLKNYTIRSEDYPFILAIFETLTKFKNDRLPEDFDFKTHYAEVFI